MHYILSVLLILLPFCAQAGSFSKHDDGIFDQSRFPEGFTPLTPGEKITFGKPYRKLRAKIRTTETVKSMETITFDATFDHVRIRTAQEGDFQYLEEMKEQGPPLSFSFIENTSRSFRGNRTSSSFFMDLEDMEREEYRAILANQCLNPGLGFLTVLEKGTDKFLGFIHLDLFQLSRTNEAGTSEVHGISLENFLMPFVQDPTVIKEILTRTFLPYWIGLIRKGYSLPPLYNTYDDIELLCEGVSFYYDSQGNKRLENSSPEFPSILQEILDVAESETDKKFISTTKEISFFNTQIITPRLLIENLKIEDLTNPMVRELIELDEECFERLKDYPSYLLEQAAQPIFIAWDRITKNPVACTGGFFKDLDNVQGEWKTHPSFKGQGYGWEAGKAFLMIFLKENGALKLY